jgi:ABC-type lipoprotein release transport system permease subunit
LGEIECQVGQRFPWRGFLMELVAFILALPPAWRATRISPMEAIRTV